MRLKIIYMGTPEFAVPTLELLIEREYDIVGVITAVDKLGGRGRKQLIESPVKKAAIKHNLKVLQPKNLKSPLFLKELKGLAANLQIVVAFRMLPEVVWNMPSLGTYNLHGSLLPKYRGAAPINWAIINGERETGVTFFKLKHEIDTGDLLISKKIEIYPLETASELHDRMMEVSAQTVFEGVKMIEAGNVHLIEQDGQLVTKAPKIFKEDCKVNFANSTYQVFNFIRGLMYYPAPWFKLDGKEHKIYKAGYYTDGVQRKPGRILTDNKTYLNVSTIDGYIYIKEIKQEGKRNMRIKEFLNGYSVKSNWID